MDIQAGFGGTHTDGPSVRARSGHMSERWEGCACIYSPSPAMALPGEDV